MKVKTRKIGFVVFVIVLLTTMCSIAGARRVRWSPYVHGLVSGDLRYSIYAGRLICRDYHYSPYWPIVRQEVCHQVPKARSYKPRGTLEQGDARKVIHNYLKTKGVVSDFKMSNLLTGVDGKTISIDFEFAGNRCIVIKFWDVKKMFGAIGHRKEYYESYIAKWEKFWPDYLAKGGKIYLIMSPNKANIEKELERILSTCF